MSNSFGDSPDHYPLHGADLTEREEEALSLTSGREIAFTQPGNTEVLDSLVREACSVGLRGRLLRCDRSDHRCSLQGDARPRGGCVRALRARPRRRSQCTLRTESLDQEEMPC